jgi:hypothetical protein
MDPLRATIEEFAAEGYTHISCHCPRCRVTRIRCAAEKQRRSERDGAMTLERFAEVLLMGAVAFALAVMALAVADVLAQLL